MGDTLVLTMGVALIGTLISAVLYGITITQTYLYFQRFPNDHVLIKLMVATLWVLDTLHLSLISHSMFYYLIANYNNPPSLLSAVWSFNLEVSINGIIGFIVECFFARRLLRLSGGSWMGWVLTLLVCGLSLIHFGLGVYFTDRLFNLKFFVKFPELTWITKVGLGSAAACDLIIATGLCWYLFKSRTGYRKTDSLIVTLMVYTLNCGLLTGVCATMVIIMFSLFPESLLFMAFFWVLGKLYCNSCVAMLNSRQSLRGRLGYVPSTPSDLPSKLSVPGTVPRLRNSYYPEETTTFDTTYPRPPTPQPVLTVRVDTTTETTQEYYKSNPYHTQQQQETSSVNSSSDPRDTVTVIPSPSSMVPLMHHPVGSRSDPWIQHRKFP